MADGDVVMNSPAPLEDEDVEEDEYNVEDIRAERKNPRTGVLEYLIKWENYPETQNTWEPIDNLKCPDIIQRFKEREKTKRKRRSSTQRDSTQTGSTTKKPRQTEEPIIVEEEIGSTTETLSSTDTGSSLTDEQQHVVAEVRIQPKGFERGLPIEDIIASCTDDNEKLFFFVKWKGLGELDMISSDELEDRAPKELCIWYRKRLLYSMEKPDDQNRSHSATGQENPPSPTMISTAT